MTSKSRKSSKENMLRLFNRYVWLVEVIYQSKRITFERINELWRRSELNESGSDLPIKTFHNHRKAIEEMFCINIECDRKAGYLYYIENSDDLKTDTIRQWMLNAFALNGLFHDSHKLKHRILVENVPNGLNFLPRIIGMMGANRTIDITYQSFWKDEPSLFEVAPYCIKMFRQRWYMLAKSIVHGDLRIYALDRMLNIEKRGNKFEMPIDFDAEGYFYNSFGIIVDEDVPIEPIVIKVFGNKVKYLRTLPLHHSQTETDTADHYTTFEYKLRPTFDFRQELLSHGDQIEVVSPKWLRKEMKDIIKSMIDVHRHSDRLKTL